MCDNTIIFNSYNDVDLNMKEVRYIEPQDNITLEKYIIDTCDFVINESKRCQLYKLKRDSNEIFTIITQILSSEDNSFRKTQSKIIADILLETELKAIRGAAKPSDGALVQSIIRKDDNIVYYTLIKNEFFSAINKTTIKPVEAFLNDKKKKSPLKICIFEIQSVAKVNHIEYNILNIYVDDSIKRDHGPTWYDNFLGLEKCNSDEVNTGNAVDKIITFWDKVIEDKKQFINVRNDTLSYFRTKDQFDIEDYINNIKDRNEFEGMNELLEKMKDVPNSKRKGFDSRFNIVKNHIKKRVSTKKFKPSQKIELLIDGVIDPNEIFVTKEDENYILKIRTNDRETIECLIK